VTAATAGDARAFLTRVLANEALLAEQPLAFAAGETLELVEEGEVRAACVVLVREFVLGARRVRGGLIGSVATDPAWRRRGLATRLLQKAEETLAARGCVFALLWADAPDFYLKRGYAPGGVENDYLLVSELAQACPAPSGVRALRPGDEPFVQHLYEHHPVRVERTLAETRALLAVPGMLTLVRERASSPAHPPQVVAYACLGRGHDLADTLHEWGGASEDVLALVRAHLERRFPAGESGALFLMTPASAVDLGYRLLQLGAPTQRGILGLAKLLDGAAAGALLASVLGPSATARWNGHALVLRGPLGEAELELDTVQALLLGAAEVHDEARSFLARLGFERAPLPLEPFAFGLDSI